MILCGGSDSGKLKSPEHDFKYLYWTISKTLFRNLFTCKGTYMIDWVGRMDICDILLMHRLNGCVWQTPQSIHSEWMDMRDIYSWHDQSECATSQINMCDMTEAIWVTWLKWYVWQIYSNVWHCSIWYVDIVTRIRMCDMVYLYVWHDSLDSLDGWHTHSNVWHCSIWYVDIVTRIWKCDMVYLYVWHDSLDVWHTHSLVWHLEIWLICVVTRLPMCDMVYSHV